MSDDLSCGAWRHRWRHAARRQPKPGWVLSAAALLMLLTPGGLRAESRRFRTDNAVAAWNTRTGVERWRSFRPGLSFASFKLAPGVLVVQPEIGSQGIPTFYLDAQTGKPLTAPPDDPSLVASSSTAMPGPVTLQNGWKLVGFNPGFAKKLEFARLDGSHWSIDTSEYPYCVQSWKDTVLWTGSDAIMHAY